METQRIHRSRIGFCIVTMTFVSTVVAQNPALNNALPNNALPNNAVQQSVQNPTPQQQQPVSGTPPQRTPVPNESVPNQRPNMIVPVAPFRLTAQEQTRVDEILAYWEHRSNKVQTYTTKFTRFEYDPVYGPNEPNTARTVGNGVIRYSSPDKGEFKLETIGNYVPPKAASEKPQYPQETVEFDEHWICDGASFFEFNTNAKQLIETKLPPEMQGDQITDGPLPFMFGATKEKLIERYWIRELKPPTERKGEYWLEVYPKLREDALNFSRVGVILDEKHFLPQGLQIYATNYDATKNWARTVYTFTDREVNNPLDRGRQFIDRFISPKPPLGWKKVVSNYGDPIAPNGNPRATAGKPQGANQPPNSPR